MQQIIVEIGKNPPVHPDYLRLKLEWDFWDNSYIGGSRFKDTKDCTGKPVLVQHACENNKGYDARKSLTTYHNYPRAVTDRLVSIIFSRPITRDSSLSVDRFMKNVDGHGTNLNVFMHNKMLKAAVLGIWGIVVDSNLINLPTSKLVETEIGTVLLRDVDPRSCINWNIDRSSVLLKHEKTIQLVDDVNVTTWELDDDGTVLPNPTIIPHGWIKNPITWMYGCADVVGPEASLIGDVSEHSRLLINYCSWLAEELQKATFSQFILAAPNLDENKLANVPLGSRNWLVIPLAATDVKWECIGSDPAQAESLRESIRQEVESIYRSVGLQAPDNIRSSTESGIALRIRLSEMSSNAARLAHNAEQAENNILELCGNALGIKIEKTNYPDPEDMDEGSIAEELNQALSIITANVPKTIKAKSVELFANKKFNKMEKPEKDAMLKEIAQYYADEDVKEDQKVDSENSES